VFYIKIAVCLFVIALSVLRFTDSAYPFHIFKLLLNKFIKIKIWFTSQSVFYTTCHNFFNKKNLIIYIIYKFNMALIFSKHMLSIKNNINSWCVSLSFLKSFFFYNSTNGNKDLYIAHKWCHIFLLLYYIYKDLLTHQLFILFLIDNICFEKIKAMASFFILIPLFRLRRFKNIFFLTFWLLTCIWNNCIKL
jgi:hypothetical protein